MHRSSIRFKCIYICTYWEWQSIYVYSFNDIPFLSGSMAYYRTLYKRGVCDSIRRRKIKNLHSNWSFNKEAKAFQLENSEREAQQFVPCATFLFFNFSSAINNRAAPDIHSAVFSHNNASKLIGVQGVEYSLQVNFEET